MASLQDIYLSKCSSPSDINEHLPNLYSYACKCESIVEMGTRDGVSIYALAYAKPSKLISIDLVSFEGFAKLKTLCDLQGTNYTHLVSSSLEVEIPEVDFLFIDTEHSYLQLITELTLHSNKIKKFIAIHDTVTYGYTDSSAYGDQGLRYKNGYDVKHGLIPAINDFLEVNKNWSIDRVYNNNNGMIFLKNISN
jgi:hypothetical protein